MAKKKIVRPDHKQVVRHPDGYPVTVFPGYEYDADDPLVEANPDVFRSDSDRDVEQATAEPGEKRSTKRKK